MCEFPGPRSQDWGGVLLPVLMVGCATLSLVRWRACRHISRSGFHSLKRRADGRAQVSPMPPQDAGQRTKGTCTGQGVMKMLKTPWEVRILDVFSACTAERASLSASTRVVVVEQGQMATLRSLLTARRPASPKRTGSWGNGGELKASSHSSHTTAR